MIFSILSVALSIFFLYISVVYLGWGDALEFTNKKDSSKYLCKSAISLIFAGIFMVLGWILYFI